MTYCKQAHTLSLEKIFGYGKFKTIDYILRYHNPQYAFNAEFLSIIRDEQDYGFRPRNIVDRIYDDHNLIPAAVPPEVDDFFIKSTDVYEEIPQIIKVLQQEDFLRKDSSRLQEMACITMLCTSQPKVGEELYPYVNAIFSDNHTYEHMKPFTEGVLWGALRILQKHLPPLQYTTLSFYIDVIHKNLVDRKYGDLDNHSMYSDAEINIINTALRNIYQNATLQNEISQLIFA